LVGHHQSQGDVPLYPLAFVVAPAREQQQQQQQQQHYHLWLTEIYPFWMEAQEGC
jgi:hypothetical protein